MKIIFTALLFACFSLSVSAQKLITTINSGNAVESFSFKYSPATGSWIYADYDTTAKKNVLITPKGNSKEYAYAMQYNALFDDAGNVYSYAYNNITDTTYQYFLLKNTEEIGTFSFIGDGWDINNGVIYFMARDNGGAYVAAYDTRSGTLNKGKAYEDIYLVNYTEEYYEGEPAGFIGFTKSGEPYYLASENYEKFLVIGTTEQKHYSDIDYYTIKKDNNGEFTYIAKSKGTLYGERGNTFLVQGKTEYKTFDYIYGPPAFDKDNNVYYVASDSAGDNRYRSRMMKGNSEGKVYDGNIYEFKVSPAGKITYIVSGSIENSKTGESIYSNFLVQDSKEGKIYSSVSNLKFTDSGLPLFTASDSKNKYFVVMGDKVVSEKYDNIYDFSISGDGSVIYSSTNYGNVEKSINDKNYIHCGGEKYGPFDYVSMADYTNGRYVLTDAEGNFAFVSGRVTNKNEYLYKYKVTFSEGESSEHDAIDQVRLAKGKVVYISGEFIDRVAYKYIYTLYIDNKPVAKDYSAIMDLMVDPVTGKVSCVGCKGNSFYYLEFGI